MRPRICTARGIWCACVSWVCAWQGDTGFTIACQKGHEDIVKRLLQFPKVLDQKDNDGTPRAQLPARDACLCFGSVCVPG